MFRTKRTKLEIQNKFLNPIKSVTRRWLTPTTARDSSSTQASSTWPDLPRRLRLRNTAPSPGSCKGYSGKIAQRCKGAGKKNVRIKGSVSQKEIAFLRSICAVNLNPKSQMAAAYLSNPIKTFVNQAVRAKYRQTA